MYPVAHIVHLFMAILFIGVVFFEVLMLEGIRGRVAKGAMAEVERELGRRARRIMPFVILLLFASGIILAGNYHGALAHAGQSSFAIQLMLKILLAVSVFGHFVAAMTFMLRRTMTARRSRVIHYSVFVHVVLIALLAKTMFYL